MVFKIAEFLFQQEIENKKATDMRTRHVALK
jgi:hypothetical protein